MGVDVTDLVPPEAKRIEDVTTGYLLEQAVPLSQSRLWELQRAFYVRQGIRAWGSGDVPHQITCNPLIAAAYAEVIVAFLRDCDAAGRLDRAQRFHVLELGSGSGRFAFGLLRRLRRLLDASSLRHLPVTLVLSDFDEAKLEQLAADPRLAADVADGWLDFATVDAAAPGPVRTWRRQQVLEGGPLAVVANYVFDSLPADAYAIKAGVAHEARLSVYADAPDVDFDDPGALDRLRFGWEEAPEPAGSTGSAEMDSVLDRYADVLDSTMVVLPTAAVACLDRLATGLCRAARRPRAPAGVHGRAAHPRQLGAPHRRLLPGGHLGRRPLPHVAAASGRRPPRRGRREGTGVRQRADRRPLPAGAGGRRLR